MEAAGLDLPAAPSPAQRHHQLSMRQRPTLVGARGEAEDSDRIPAAGIVAEGSQGCRVEGPQAFVYGALNHQSLNEILTTVVTPERAHATTSSDLLANRWQTAIRSHR